MNEAFTRAELIDPALRKERIDWSRAVADVITAAPFALTGAIAFRAIKRRSRIERLCHTKAAWEPH